MPRHVERLRGDAQALGLEAIDPEAIADALQAIGERAFGDALGVVRIKACRHPDTHRTSLVADGRPFGPSLATWRARTAPGLHPGPAAAPGAKLTERTVWTEARAFRDDQGVEEALLFDEAGWLVEGTRTNLVVRRGTALRFPEPRLGAVAGVALSVFVEGPLCLEPGRIDRDDLAKADEIIAVNAVRGAKPIVLLDDEPVGDGGSGPAATKLAQAFASALYGRDQASRRSFK